MTRAELGEELGLKESYIATHWPRIVNTYARLNITLVRNGRGENSNYGIKNYGDKEIRWTVRENKRRNE